jgi:hypothetical protein
MPATGEIHFRRTAQKAFRFLITVPTDTSRMPQDRQPEPCSLFGGGARRHRFERRKLLIAAFGIVALAAVALVWLIGARGEPKDRTANRLVRALRAKLPDGWSTAYEKENAWLEITRNTAILTSSGAPNQSVNPETSLTKFSFAFRVSTLVPPAEFQSWNAENAQIEERRTVAYDKLTRSGISYKFDSFSPRSDAEKAVVAEYKEIKSSLHRLPDFYFEDISLRWAWNSPNWPNEIPEDPQIREECERVRQQIVAVLSAYENR